MHDSESYVFPDPAFTRGNKFITKIMKLKPRQKDAMIYDAEQVMRNLLWRGMQGTNKSLARIHHLRGIEVDGEPAIMIIQEKIEGDQDRFSTARIDPNSFKYFDDIQFRPNGFSNIIRTKEGLKVVDARMDEAVRNTQKCPPGKCSCNWHDFVENTASGFDPLPEGYSLPQEIKKAYDPKTNPWISQMELETKQMNRAARTGSAFSLPSKGY